MPPFNAEQQEAATKELFEYLQTKPPVSLTLRPDYALNLISQLQLALRHPGQPHHAGVMARTICDTMIKTLADGNERIERLLRWGDNPEMDEGVTGEPS